MNVEKFENEIKKIVDEIDDVEIVEITYEMSLNESIINFSGISINKLINDEKTIELNKKIAKKRNTLIDEIEKISNVYHVIELLNNTNYSNELIITFYEPIDVSIDEFKKMLDEFKLYI